MKHLAVEKGVAHSPLKSTIGFWDGANWDPGEGDSEICVIMTSERGTLAALRQAAALAQPLSARIRLLVVEIVPFPLPMDHPPVAPQVREAYLQALVAKAGVEPWIDVRLCRQPSDALPAALAPRSVCVIGGRGRWPMAPERRLAARLRRQGHVVFLAEPD
jgi:hypothetical protein